MVKRVYYIIVLVAKMEDQADLRHWPTITCSCIRTSSSVRCKLLTPLGTVICCPVNTTRHAYNVQRSTIPDWVAVDSAVCKSLAIFQSRLGENDPGGGE